MTAEKTRHGGRISSLILSVIAAGIGVVAAVALWYRLPLPDAGRTIVCILWAAFILAVITAEWSRYRSYTRFAFLLAVLLLSSWWASIKPSNDRLWADDVAHTVNGTIAGDIVTLHNVRNFRWRSLTDYDQIWETRTYDLSALSSVDMFLSTWNNPDIAHTLISFGFTDGHYVTFSVEIRKEKHEKFSEIAGFFKQYEIALIAADERDIIYTRTHVRKERVTRYPVQLSPEQRRALFLSYVARGNKLAAAPEFYNTLTANCTTVVFDMVKLIVPSIPLDPRVLLSGRLPSYIYEQGGFGRDEPLETLIARAAVSADAPYEDFSRSIRNFVE